MGWTADAMKNVETISYLSETEDSEILAAFRNAQQEIGLSGSAADGFLENGGLHLSNCKFVFQAVCGEPVRNCVWTTEKVKDFLANANWSKVTPNQVELGAILSVQSFVEICARFSLGIRFE